MAVISTNLINWSVSRDDEGHRDYDVNWEVLTSDHLDGPDTALAAAGLPLPGTSLVGIGNAYDPDAYYNAKGSARLFDTVKRTRWEVTTTFTTKPCRRCQSSPMTNPLLEPWKARGGFNKFLVEAQKDKDGEPILNSAGQRFRGKAVQIDRNHPTLSLTGNVAWLNISVIAQAVNAVNDGTWWGQDARKWKCTDFTWERLLYGNCSYYFQIVSAFELNDETWDLVPLDEGNLVLKDGKQVAATDEVENLIHTLLDGHGEKWDGTNPVFLDGTGGIPGPYRIRKEVNFGTIGWPASIPGVV